MARRIGILLTAVTLLSAGVAHAQDAAQGPGRIEVTVIPGGGTFFTSGDEGSKFGNYNLGGAFTYNVNRILGFEGEVSTSLGVSQDLELGGITSNQKSPNTATYTGNVVVSLPTRSSLVPYVTGGVGALTMFERASLGLNGAETFLTGNVGGGVKWYAPNGRWGLRGDYRFLATRSKDDAPAFFGQETRYGHRVYGAVVITVLR